MNPFSFKEWTKVASPSEEIKEINKKVEESVENLGESSSDYTKEEVVSEVVKKYSEVSPTEVLHPEYTIKGHEVESIVLQLSPEAHDKQLEHFIGILEEKGIRNAFTVIEKLNNPHLLDDFHRFLVEFISAGYTIPDLREKDDLWKPLHMSLFEVSLPDPSEEDRNKSLKELIY